MMLLVYQAATQAAEERPCTNNLKSAVHPLIVSYRHVVKVRFEPNEARAHY